MNRRKVVVRVRKFRPHIKKIIYTPLIDIQLVKIFYTVYYVRFAKVTQSEEKKFIIA